MKPEIDEQVLTAYVMGEVDAGTRAAVEKLIAEDAGVRRTVEQIRGAAEAVRAAVGAAEAGVTFGRGVPGAGVRRRSTWWGRVAVGLAASVVVGGIVSAFVVVRRADRQYAGYGLGQQGQQAARMQVGNGPKSPADLRQVGPAVPMNGNESQRPATSPSAVGLSYSGTPADQSRVAGRPLEGKLSYSYTNPFPTATAVGTGYTLNNSPTPDDAVSADVNPGVAGGQGAAGGKKMEFESSPFVGVQKDNIFTRDADGDGIADKGLVGLAVRGSKVRLYQVPAAAGESMRKVSEAPDGGGGVYRGPIAHNTEAYDRVEENPFLDVVQNPLSTFSADVDTASYSNVRRFIESGQRPPADAVRIEELLNYFPYDYSPPESGKDPFAAHLEVAECPWAAGHRLVRIGIKGKVVSEEERPASNLVFLIDVSGSMNMPNKLPLVKQSLKMLTARLRHTDHVAIAVYAGNSGLMLPSTPADQRDVIEKAIDGLEAGGSTNGAAGIELAYQTAQSAFIKGGTNRVILCTDGDWNVGITDQGALTRVIEEKAKSGTFLTVLGFGMGNLKDSTMVKLADKGNGNYGYVDSPAEAKKLFVEQLSGTLVTIAKDVKLQVEFNPAKVSSYRLIGYEKRKLAKEDFNDDTKDAGEIGAGHMVTALYEVVPVGVGATSGPSVDALKYQGAGVERRLSDGKEAGELLTVKVRYKQPDGDVSAKLEFPLTDSGETFAKASGDFKFAAAVAEYGMVLRESKYKGNASLGAVVELAEDGVGADAAGYRRGFVELVKKTQALGVK